MQQQIRFGSETINFRLVYLNRKSLGIKVHPNGSVDVLAPVGAGETEITRKIRLKAAWILKQLDHFNSFRPVTPPRRFVSGETHLYLGRQYKLKVLPAAANIVRASRGQLWIHATNTSKKVLERQLEQWYREKAAIVYREILDEIFPKFRRYKINKPPITIRVMAKRWGSCTPSGRIFLNPALIKASRGCIEYVIIHELCHLVHHNHTKSFFDLLNRILPAWEKWKHRLEHSLV